MEGCADNDIKEKGDRVFSLLPSSTSFVPSHIEINSSVLLQVWARIRQRCPKETRDELDSFKRFLIQSKRGDNMRILTSPEFQLIRDAVWREHFNISHYESGGWKFTHTITTNGYEVSVVRKRVVIGSEIPFLSTREFNPKIARDFCATKVIGLDPGMKELCTTATIRTLEEDRFYPRTHYRFRKRKRVAATRTDKWKKKQKARRAKRRRHRQRKRNMTGPVTKREHVRQLKGEHLHQHDLLDSYAIQQISTREYRHLAGFNKVRYWEEGIKRRYPAYSNLAHRVPSFKTAYSSRYWSRLKFVWTHINWLIDFCSRQAFRKQRFYTYINKSKALSHITERIVPVASPTVFVGYGNWSKREGIKGQPPGPVKGLSKALARPATVRRVDEFRTSKCCYHCHNTLEGTVFPNIENGKPHGMTFSRYALCCKNSDCNSYWDRDVNASLNIMQLTTALLASSPRPEYLQRPSSRA